MARIRQRSRGQVSKTSSPRAFPCDWSAADPGQFTADALTSLPDWLIPLLTAGEGEIILADVVSSKA
jgi:hypothetical protein